MQNWNFMISGDEAAASEVLGRFTKFVDELRKSGIAVKHAKVNYGPDDKRSLINILDLTEGVKPVAPKKTPTP